jgi:hypothetical protein
MRRASHKSFRSVVIFGLALLAASTASAQVGRPPAEIGLAAGMRWLPEYGFLEVPATAAGPSVDLRVTLPVTARRALESGFTLRDERSEFRTRTESLYFFQMKRSFGREAGRNFHPFVTYGLVGTFEHISDKARTIALANGRTHTLPAITFNRWEPPLLILAGGGFQYEFARRLAFRADAQLVTLLVIPWGARLSAGVSIPLGNYARK